MSCPTFRLYGESEGEDVVLVYDIEEDTFHAMDAICSHEGGPLELGDIEEIDGERCLVCPWHGYEFRLTDGCSDSSGLQVSLTVGCFTSMSTTRLCLW